MCEIGKGAGGKAAHDLIVTLDEYAVLECAHELRVEERQPYLLPEILLEDSSCLGGDWATKRLDVRIVKGVRDLQHCEGDPTPDDWAHIPPG